MSIVVISDGMTNDFFFLFVVSNFSIYTGYAFITGKKCYFKNGERDTQEAWHMKKFIELEMWGFPWWSRAGGMGLIHVWGAKISHATWCSQKKKRNVKVIKISKA